MVAVWEHDIDAARARRVLNRELRYVPSGDAPAGELAPEEPAPAL